MYVKEWLMYLQSYWYPGDIIMLFFCLFVSGASVLKATEKKFKGFTQVVHLCVKLKYDFIFFLPLRENV